MINAIQILNLVAWAMIIVSLFSPKRGLFFAQPAKQTQLRGFLFWSLVSVLAFCLLGLADSVQKKEKVTKEFKVFAELLAGATIFSVHLLCKPSQKNAANTHPSGQVNPALDTYRLQLYLRQTGDKVVAAAHSMDIIIEENNDRHVLSLNTTRITVEEFIRLRGDWAHFSWDAEAKAYRCSDDTYCVWEYLIKKENEINAEAARLAKIYGQKAVGDAIARATPGDPYKTILEDLQSSREKELAALAKTPPPRLAK